VRSSSSLPQRGDSLEQVVGEILLIDILGRSNGIVLQQPN
jgi:hypothetical protein